MSHKSRFHDPTYDETAALRLKVAEQNWQQKRDREEESWCWAGLAIVFFLIFICSLGGLAYNNNWWGSGGQSNQWGGGGGGSAHWNNSD
jgi:hypothetical protein